MDPKYRSAAMLFASMLLGSLSTRVSLAQTPTSSEAAAAGSEVMALESVTVTARRVSEDLQQVPLTVTALTSEKLEAQNILTPFDLQRVTPALTLSSTSRGFGAPGIAIRGLRQWDASLSTDPPVGVYFGEVGQSRPQGTTAALFDLQSVQVLKGPQGTLFGRNTTGGAILFTPKPPTDKLGGYVKGSWGDFDFNDYEGVLNVPLSDTFAMRAAAKFTDRRGYIHEVTEGDRGGGIDAENYRLSLRWTPSDAVDSTLLGYYFANDDLSAIPHVTSIYPQFVSASFRSTLTPLLEQELAAHQALGFHQTRSDTPHRDRSRAWGAQNITQIELNDTLSLKNIAGYREINHLNAGLDSDGTALDLIEATARLSSKQYSDELQLLGNANGIDYIFGLFYYQEKGTEELEICAFCMFQTPRRPNITGGEAKNTSYSAYTHFNFELESLLEGLSLSLGGRVTHDKRDFVIRSRNRVLLPGGGIGFACTTSSVVTTTNDPSACGLPLDTSGTQPTWELSFNYQLNPNTLIYLAHRRGYRSGGLSSQTRTLTDPYQFAPEKVSDIELGSKMDFHIGEAPARTNLAAYHTWMTDRQIALSAVRTPVGGVPTPSSFITNAPKSHISGIEAEFSVEPVEGLELSLGYSYVNAVNDELVDHYVSGGVARSVDISDSKFAFIPKHQFNASAQYLLPLPRSIGEVTTQLGFYYQSKMYFHDTNTTNCGVDGAYPACPNRFSYANPYGLVSLRAEWNEPFGHKFSVAAFATNLTDKEYDVFGSQTFVVGAFSDVAGPPRMIGVELKVPFGDEQ